MDIGDYSMQRCAWVGISQLLWGPVYLFGCSKTAYPMAEFSG
jgi:hypothetical protein